MAQVSGHKHKCLVPVRTLTKRQKCSALPWEQSEPAQVGRLSFVTDIPAELRAPILQHLLVTDKPVANIAAEGLDRFGSKRASIPSKPQVSRCPVEILVTCKQLHSEAATIFYSQNIFLCADLVLWAKDGKMQAAIGERYVALIRHVVAEDMDHWPFSWESLVNVYGSPLKKLPTIHTFTFRLCSKTMTMLDMTSVRNLSLRGRVKKNLTSIVFPLLTKAPKDFTLQITSTEMDESALVLCKQLEDEILKALNLA